MRYVFSSLKAPLRCLRQSLRDPHLCPVSENRKQNECLQQVVPLVYLIATRQRIIVNKRETDL